VNAVKKFLIGGILAAALAGAPALAADMPVKAPPAAAASMFNWTGFYVGGTAGYGWAKTNICDNGGCLLNDGFHADGVVGGPTVGVNWQASGSPLLLGIEADWSWTHLKGVHPSTGFGCGPGNCLSELTSLGTVRGRVGIASGPVLYYGTAGIAYGRLHGALEGLQDAHSTKSAAVFGGGVEYAFAPNWSAKVEYLHVDNFGRAPAAPSFCGGGCVIGEFKTDIVRAGLNYRFGGDPWGKAPVVAKY
jgi:outer membrane immunogenic protein